MAARLKCVLRHLWAWRITLILFLTPIILLPLPLVLNTKEAYCGYVIIMMAVFWVSEAMPVGVTALIPVVLFPFFGILSSEQVASSYMNDINMLFMGGLMTACAIEYWNIHRRVALGVLMLVGSNPRWLMMGMMAATWFLSMWISNTATTAMMIPIAEAVLVQLKKTQTTGSQEKKNVESKDTKDIKDPTTENNNKEIQLEIFIPDRSETGTTRKSSVIIDPVVDVDDSNVQQEEDPSFTKMCKGFSLSICYAANSGGIGSLTGTGPNLALKAHADRIYQSRGIRNPVTFTSWMAFGLPLAALEVLMCWAWLQIAYVRVNKLKSKGNNKDKHQSKSIREVIREEYRKLGPIVCGQVVLFFLFIALVTLWITRDLGGSSGWGRMFKPPIKDGSAAIFIAILLFALPSTLPCLKSYGNTAHPSTWERQKMKSLDTGLLKAEPLEIKPILYWKIVHDKMPWHLLFLLGGGYAMSKGCEASGLSRMIGQELTFLAGWNRWAILFIICAITSAATEVTSNTAIATLLMPIMSEMAISTGAHPLYYMFAAALSCSFSFMLPVGTPPNAIVFAYGRVKMIDMISTGFILNILSIPILIGTTATVGNAVFDFNNIPVEFLNSTIA